MQFNLVAVVGLFASFLPVLSSATALKTRQSSNTSTDIWPVTGFETDCSQGGCVFRFVVSRAASQFNAGFNTSCNGTDVAGGYQLCKDKTVSANLIPQTYPLWGLEVKHMWATDNQGGFSEAYANATVSSPTTDFTVKVYKMDGVN
jgi:hypothetical protein